MLLKEKELRRERFIIGPCGRIEFRNDAQVFFLASYYECTT